MEAETTEELERKVAASVPLELDRFVAAKSILRERYAKPERHIALWTLFFSAIAALTGVLVFIRE